MSGSHEMKADSSVEVTGLLLAWRGGDDAALERMMPVVYDELRRRAYRYMAGERVEHTLQATALVNEVYLRLVDSKRVDWQNRVHFLAVSAQLMRRVLVDFARSKQSQKRGEREPRVTLDDGMIAAPERGEDLVALDDALKALESVDSRKSQVVELRFFGGLTAEETAEVLDVSPDTVLRDWKLAKVWLLRELTHQGAEK